MTSLLAAVSVTADVILPVSNSLPAFLAAVAPGTQEISWLSLFSAIQILQAMWGTAFSFMLLTVVFWPLEKLYPAREGQGYFRPDWLTDTAFFLGQYLVWNSLVFSLALPMVHGMVTSAMPHAVAVAIHALPWWVQAALAVLLGDFAIYWGHRFQHNNEWLWRFHAVHHSSEHLDWLAAHREHPLDTIYTASLVNLPAILLGFPVATLAGLVAFRGMWAIYIHSNVRLPIGPLRVLIGAPELHHWHHDLDRGAGNYGNVSPIMDVLFGTYRCPDHEPRAFGISEPFPKSYLGQLLHPLRLWPWPVPAPAAATEDDSHAKDAKVGEGSR